KRSRRARGAVRGARGLCAKPPGGRSRPARRGSDRRTSGRMKILHLTTFLQGGAGRIIVELAREQQRLGHEVTVVASRRGVPGYGNDEEYIETLSSFGIPAMLVSSTFERSHS